MKTERNIFQIDLWQYSVRCEREQKKHRTNEITEPKAEYSMK